MTPSTPSLSFSKRSLLQFVELSQPNNSSSTINASQGCSCVSSCGCIGIPLGKSSSSSSSSSNKQQQSQTTGKNFSQSPFSQSKSSQSYQSSFAIGKRKLTLLREFLCFRHENAPFFILTGPSGSGKWTCLKGLAAEFGFQNVQEYEAQCFFDQHAFEFSSSIFDNFTQFILSAFSTASKSLFVVRELPNVWESHSIRTKFFALQLRMLRMREKGLKCAPVVFVVTDAFNGSKDHLEFFCSEFRHSPLVNCLVVGEVSNAVMKKILSNSSSISCTTNLEPLVLASGGDLRYAFTLASLFPPSMSSTNLAPFGRECSLGLFHALGKVFYKRKDFAIFDFLQSFGSGGGGANESSIGNFNGFLEQNIFDHYDSIEVISEFLELLSLADSCGKSLFSSRSDDNCLVALPAFYLQNVCTVPMVPSYKPFKRPMAMRFGER